MVDIQTRLKSVTPIIQELLKISGSAGLSPGVLHQNETIYTANYGYQDVTNQVCPTFDTLYWVGSIAKSLTAAAIGALVEDCKLQWDSRVSDILPEFQHQDPEIRRQGNRRRSSKPQERFGRESRNLAKGSC